MRRAIKQATITAILGGATVYGSLYLFAYLTGSTLLAWLLVGGGLVIATILGVMAPIVSKLDAEH